MATWVVLASGQSLTDKDIEYVKSARDQGKIKGVVSISNVGLDKAPWADFLVAHDARWWAAYPEALEFKGRKFCRQKVKDTEQFVPSIPNGCNSGFMAMEVAWKIGKAKRILILGLDMHGTHYFGPHTANKLKNTTDARFRGFIRQFDKWRGCPVINCNPKSALKKFPFSKIEEVI